MLAGGAGVPSSGRAISSRASTPCETVELEPDHRRPDRNQHLIQRIDPSVEHAPILKTG